MAHHLPESNQNDPKKERMMRMIVTTMPWSRRGNGGWWPMVTTIGVADLNHDEDDKNSDDEDDHDQD